MIKLLLIEDDPIDTALLKKTISELSQHDHGEITYDYDQALCLADVEVRLKSYQPDVILLDLHLPDGSGQACLEFLLSLNHDAPIIVMTGLNDDALARKLIGLGAQDFICKDMLSHDALYRAITYSIERQKLLVTLEQTQKELAFVNKKVRQYSKSKTEFTSMVSHELRTPITVMMAILDNLEDMVLGPLTDDQLHYVRLLKNNGTRLSGLVTDILDLSQQETGKFRVRLKESQMQVILEDTLRGYSLQADKDGISYTYAIAPELPKMYLDEHKIVQVMTNLLNNAFKFTKEGGKISVDVSVKPNALSQRDEVVFSIQDTGIGVPEEKKGLIFDPYVQAHWSSTRTANGAGLGLTICRGIIEQHDGRIWVENNAQEQGSKFTFTLPVITPKTDPRVLIVESNSLSAKLIKQIVSRVCDHEIYTVKDGVQAMLKMEILQPDLIISDVLMPRMDGIELFDVIQKNYAANAPEFIFIAELLTDEIKEALDERPVRYLTRPINESLLMDYVCLSIPA